MDRGELDAAHAALERADPPPEIPDSAHWHSFLDSRARLLVLRGDLRGGLEATLDCGRRFSELGGRNPGWIAWRSRAALCLARLDEDAQRSRALAEEEVEVARAIGAPRALGHALRVNGLVVGGDSGLEQLRDAVDLLEPSTARLELAHALCELGSALRRRGERVASREPLRRAVELAQACGAAGLTRHAHEEMLATGARPRRMPVSGRDSLTPSERRVAAMAADGLANREIAQSLFVSLKTVEMHLSRTYRKLDIASRSELPRALS
jgi:DNA-binding CsgD family transcriptional regulator